MDVDPNLVAAGGIVGALIVAVFRLLAADSPMGRAADRLEDQLDATQEDLGRERRRNDALADRIAALATERDQWRARALDAGWRHDGD